MDNIEEGKKKKKKGILSFGAGFIFIAAGFLCLIFFIIWFVMGELRYRKCVNNCKDGSLNFVSCMADCQK